MSVVETPEHFQTNVSDGMVVDGSNPESPHDDMVTESLDQSIALELEQIENGSHPTLLKAIEGVKKKKEWIYLDD